MRINVDSEGGLRYTLFSNKRKKGYCSHESVQQRKKCCSQISGSGNEKTADSSAEKEHNMRITDDILYVGVNDHNIDLFEGQYIVPNGMAYNSYVINDEKIAVMDTVDVAFGDEWLKNIADVLNGATPDYLIIQHVEPDHSANIQKFLEVYPNTKVVGNAKTFTMIGNFFRDLKLADENKLEVKNKDTLTLGKHELTFVFAPMVHWPEVMVTYDSKDKVLFSADGLPEPDTPAIPTSFPSGISISMSLRLWTRAPRTSIASGCCGNFIAPLLPACASRRRSNT